MLDADADTPNRATAARYLNRLSDLLFILARSVNTKVETLWQPGAGR